MVALQLTVTTLSAQSRGVDTLFPARPVGYINDFAGLLPEPSRDVSGYRRYDAEHAVQLVKIKTLAEAGVLAELRRHDAEPVLELGDAAAERVELG